MNMQSAAFSTVLSATSFPISFTLINLMTSSLRNLNPILRTLFWVRIFPRKTFSHQVVDVASKTNKQTTPKTFHVLGRWVNRNFLPNFAVNLKLFLKINPV